MRQFDNEKNGTEFAITVPGKIIMEGFMNANVCVKLGVNTQYRDLLQVTVTHPKFKHKFTLAVSQLSDGRDSDALTECGWIRPAESNRVSIQPFTWHWQIPVEVARHHIDEFLSAAEHFCRIA